MAKKRGKVHVGREGDGRIPEIMDDDMISKLPDHILLHILSFLPTIYAVQTSALSRRWRRMWCLVPCLKFSKFHIKRNLIYKFVDQCLTQREMFMCRDASLVITRFKLDMYYDGRSSQMDRWLSFATKHHLQELDLALTSNEDWSKYYCLPHFVLNVTSLRILNLQNVKLEVSYPVSLLSLKSLSLSGVHVEDELLSDIVSSCPSLEKLFIELCTSLSGLRISSSSLKFLHVDGDWLQIQVEATNLESFVYFGYSPCDFDLSSSQKLTSLSMSGALFFHDYAFQDLIAGFPLLESLALYGCNPVDIRHQYLKVLVYEKEYDREDWDKYEISIDAPNLVSFSYNGHGKLVKFCLNSPNLLETNVSLSRYSDNNLDWYLDVIDFLSYLDCSDNMCLNVSMGEVLMVPEKLRKFCRSPLPNLKHLKVTTWPGLQRESDLREALLWLSPALETLSIRLYRNGNTIW